MMMWYFFLNLRYSSDDKPLHKNPLVNTYTVYMYFFNFWSFKTSNILCVVHNGNSKMHEILKFNINGRSRYWHLFKNEEVENILYEQIWKSIILAQPSMNWSMKIKKIDLMVQEFFSCKENHNLCWYFVTCAQMYRSCIMTPFGILILSDKIDDFCTYGLINISLYQEIL